jgi:hypothetical protein
MRRIRGFPGRVRSMTVEGGEGGSVPPSIIRLGRGMWRRNVDCIWTAEEAGSLPERLAEVAVSG